MLNAKSVQSRFTVTLSIQIRTRDRQWRRQGLMVGEAHLVGEANIFNVKYIIHECRLPTICRPPLGRHLLDRHTYSGLQHFLG